MHGTNSLVSLVTLVTTTLTFSLYTYDPSTTQAKSATVQVQINYVMFIHLVYCQCLKIFLNAKEINPSRTYSKLLTKVTSSIKCLILNKVHVCYYILADTQHLDKQRLLRIYCCCSVDYQDWVYGRLGAIYGCGVEGCGWHYHSHLFRPSIFQSVQSHLLLPFRHAKSNIN